MNNHIPLSTEKIKEYLKEVFNKDFKVEMDTVDLENDTVWISGICIQFVPNSFEQKSIVGVKKLGGFIVQKLVVFRGYPDQPDDVDFENIGEPYRSFEQALIVVAGLLAENHMSGLIEADQLAAIDEEAEKLAKELKL